MDNTLKVCPKCGSYAIDHSTIANTAVCRACGWSGACTQAPSIPITGRGLEDPSITFAREFRNTLAKDCGVIIGRMLVRWGFVPNDVKAEELGRYLNAIAKAAIIAILQTRQDIEVERVRATAPKA